MPMCAIGQAIHVLEVPSRLRCILMMVDVKRPRAFWILRG